MPKIDMTLALTAWNDCEDTPPYPEEWKMMVQSTRALACFFPKQLKAYWEALYEPNDTKNRGGFI